jgi:hypothetical protein
MISAEIPPGKRYAVREPARPGVPLQRVEVVEKVRGRRWKVRFLDEPHPGLTDYVKSANIVVAWADYKAFLRDEERHRRLLEASDRTWPGKDHPVSDAVDLVFESTGEHLSTYGTGGILSAAPDTLERIRDRAGQPSLDSPLGYTDRGGTRHLPFDLAAKLAKGFAAKEPQAVLLHIESQEREYELKAREPGRGYLVGLVEEWRAGWALARQWAGFDEALSQRDAEIKRQREIIERAIWDLRRSGADDVASRMDRQLRGR